MNDEINVRRIVPQNLVEWLEDFCRQLDAEKPERPHIVYDPRQDINYYQSLGAWETQQVILKRLRYAIEQEKKLNGSLKND